MTMTVLLGADAEARKSRPVTLDPTSTASMAFVVVATECRDHWRTNEALLLESRAMPHLHQTRVGIRRLRSSFSLFRPLLDAVPGAFDVAHRLRTLALPLGPARDLDVLLTAPSPTGSTPGRSRTSPVLARRPTTALSRSCARASGRMPGTPSTRSSPGRRGRASTTRA